TQLQTDPMAIHVLNRATLIHDGLQLAKVGRMRYDTAFETCHYLNNETSYLPWRSFYFHLEDIDNRLQKSSFYTKWTRYMLSQMQQLIGKNFDSDVYQERVLRKD